MQSSLLINITKVCQTSYLIILRAKFFTYKCKVCQTSDLIILLVKFLTYKCKVCQTSDLIILRAKFFIYKLCKNTPQLHLSKCYLKSKFHVDKHDAIVTKSHDTLVTKRFYYNLMATKIKLSH